MPHWNLTVHEPNGYRQLLVLGIRNCPAACLRNFNDGLIMVARRDLWIMDMQGLIKAEHDLNFPESKLVIGAH